ncbi:restriction endonuclease subunit S [Mammaliicoccus lentus]|uniref:restriction endonuclease subunit S n=1 Tax=Mammaliicoccus lentus TaxID=42858 RepID=UPI002DB7B72C|nr:restriction endonuclease subunit S [Mammaliicoccus lentus]MEB5686930.1 restriction endonuclease subunit S [Mammaliicoccus lentus]
MTNQVKKVPELRFPEFDGEWEEKKLGDIAHITMGQSPKSSNYTNNDQDMVLVQGNADMKKGQIYPRIYTIEITKLAEIDDILLSVRAPVGELAIAQIRACIGRGVCAINANKFVYYNLELFKVRNTWKLFSQGSTFESISGNEIKKINFQIPISKSEQQKIGGFFSKLDRQIELEEQKLEKLEEQKKGYMQKIFSQEVRFKDDHGNEYPNWETKKLDNILSERNYKQVPEKDVPLMAFTSTGGIEDKGERYNREFLVKNKNKKYKRTEFNDLIYSSNNLDVGAIGLNRYGTSVISDVYEIFVVKEKTSPQYIEMAITQPKFMYKILKYRQGALYGQFKIHPRDFLNIYIELPSTKEQNKIGDFLNELDELIEKQSHKIELLKERKKGFLQKMFV